MNNGLNGSSSHVTYLEVGDHFRSDTQVAEVIYYQQDERSKAWTVGYLIEGRIASGLCTLALFLEHFPHRVDVRPVVPSSSSHP